MKITTEEKRPNYRETHCDGLFLQTCNCEQNTGNTLLHSGLVVSVFLTLKDAYIKMEKHTVIIDFNKHGLWAVLRDQMFRRSTGFYNVEPSWLAGLLVTVV